ncbi:MAG: hypothetical protein JWM05_3614 [Acidimicrobiales bacterium]|nr:hypothetical protein [Acidimicrobiales bacterium]
MTGRRSLHASHAVAALLLVGALAGCGVTTTATSPRPTTTGTTTTTGGSGTTAPPDSTEAPTTDGPTTSPTSPPSSSDPGVPGMEKTLADAYRSILKPKQAKCLAHEVVTRFGSGSPSGLSDLGGLTDLLAKCKISMGDLSPQTSSGPGA